MPPKASKTITKSSTKDEMLKQIKTLEQRNAKLQEQVDARVDRAQRLDDASTPIPLTSPPAFFCARRRSSMRHRVLAQLCPVVRHSSRALRIDQDVFTPYANLLAANSISTFVKCIERHMKSIQVGSRPKATQLHLPAQHSLCGFALHHRAYFYEVSDESDELWVFQVQVRAFFKSSVL